MFSSERSYLNEPVTHLHIGVPSTNMHLKIHAFKKVESLIGMANGKVNLTGLSGCNNRVKI